MGVQIEIRGEREIQELFNLAHRVGEPKEIRDALRPAAYLVRGAVRDEAPVQTGALRRSVVVRSGRGPIVMVAVDRKKALRVSPRYPSGFPYVNSVISEKRRGSKADKFVQRGFDKVAEAAADMVVQELAKTFDRIVR